MDPEKIITEIKSGIEETRKQFDETKKTVEEMKENSVKTESFEELKGCVEEVKNAINDLETKSRFMGSTEKKDKYFPGQRLARLWKATLVADAEKKSVSDVIKDIYSKDEGFVEETKALAAGGNAGVLIEEDYWQEIIPLLYNKLVVMQLGARKVPMPKGNLNIRKMVSGCSASWVGESKTKNADQPKFGNLRLTAKKLLVKVPWSNDLIRSASPEADQIVLDDMIMQLRVSMDYTALYGSGTEFTPMGIKKSTGVTLVSATTTKVDGDLLYTKLVVPVKKANIPMESLGWAFNPDVFAILYNEQFDNGTYKYRDELKQGRFHGYPIVETNQISTATTGRKTTDIFFGDWAQLMIGNQVDLEVRTSEEATYQDAEGNDQNAFDNDETVARGLMICDMGVVYGPAFSVGTYATTDA